MKKVYLSADYTLSHRDGSESFALYTGIDALEGGWMLETSGDPVGLSDLENADRCDDIDKINAIIADASTPWEECSDNDAAYIADTLEAWGIQ